MVSATLKRILWEQALLFVWVFVSAGVILYNKYVLSGPGQHFPYPITLTAWHQVCCSTVACGMVLCKCTGKPVEGVTGKVYLQRIMPIGLLYAMTLSLGNAVYLHLTVSFIQMLKALTPVVVYFTSMAFNVDHLNRFRFISVLVISAGIAVASMGEIRFDTVGVIVQLMSMVCEAFRIVCIQVLLQRQGLKLDPISTMFYIAPACVFFLSIPALWLEGPSVLAVVRGEGSLPSPGIVVGNGMAAVVLNLTVYLVLSRLSALSMNVAGVVKDWLLIYLSHVLFHSPFTALQTGGFSFALVGMVAYNWEKERERSRKSSDSDRPKAPSR